jgi:hypothetical protein
VRASCVPLPTCASGFKFNGTGFDCVTTGSISPLIVSQSETPIAGTGSQTVQYMGLGGQLRNTPISLGQVQGPISFKNLRCNTNNGTITAGESVAVELVHTQTYGGAATSFSPALTQTLDGTNNTNGPAVDSDTTNAITGYWIGYKLTISGAFPTSSTESNIFCSVERAS